MSELGDRMRALEVAIGRLEERLRAHCEAEALAWSRRQGVAPWLSLLVASAALLLAVAK